MNFLAFDLGATSGRAIIGSINDGRLSTDEVYRFPNEIKESDGKYYWDINSLFVHFKNALKQVASSGVRIESIGIDTWGVDFGCIGPDGSILGLPRAYRDPYTDGIPEEVFGIIPKEELYKATGIQIMNFNSIFQIYAQSKEADSPIHGAKEILFMPDLLSYFLTGCKVCEYTIASTSGLIDPRTRNFDRSLLERLGVDPSILPEIVQPGTVVGLLRPELCEETGMDPVPVVAVAGHDTASAIAAVPASDENFAYLSSGTWSLMGIESPVPVINEESYAFNITNEGGIEGTTRFLKNITGMWLLEQSRKTWEKEGRKYTYAQIEQMGREAIGFPSVIDPDDPRFAAPKDMDAEIKAALKESGQLVPRNDGEMISCIYHSLTARYKEVLSMLQDFASFRISKLHVIGGGSANKLVSQLTADTLGIPVVAGPVEGTAIGNIMIQAKVAGLVKDRWEMRRIIADSIETVTYLPNNQ
ncbi:MAG: rhamnulokinase [Bacteroidales bacterium]|nr:rhamnulokinase [Bacteroidales bacterium]